MEFHRNSMNSLEERYWSFSTSSAYGMTCKFNSEGLKWAFMDMDKFTLRWDLISWDTSHLQVNVIERYSKWLVTDYNYTLILSKSISPSGSLEFKGVLSKSTIKESIHKSFCQNEMNQFHVNSSPPPSPPLVSMWNVIVIDRPCRMALSFGGFRRSHSLINFIFFLNSKSGANLCNFFVGKKQKN